MHHPIKSLKPTLRVLIGEIKVWQGKVNCHSYIIGGIFNSLYLKMAEI